MIAIEDYETLPKLSGVNTDANEFYTWLVKKKGLAEDSIFACADKQQCSWATNGTKATEITNELFNLWRKVTDWGDAGVATTEFFFYYSGHGFANTKTSNDKPVDHLVASDFQNAIMSGDKCLEFYKIKESLYRSLGPVTHYYFIDACRNTNNDVKPTGLSFNPPQATNGSTGASFWLFSTARQEVAARDSEFARALVEGLGGAGSAADWYKARFWVMFQNLCEYVDRRIQKRSAQQVDADQEGKGRGLILEVKPVPEYECQIVIDNAKPTDEFTLSISTQGSPPDEIEFKGGSYKFQRAPGYHNITLTHTTAEVVQKEPPPSDEGVSLFENLAMRFEMDTVAARREVSAERGRVSPNADVMFTALPMDEIQLENLGSGFVRTKTGTFESEVEPGDYLITLRQSGRRIGSKRLNIKRGAMLTLDLRDPELNLVSVQPSPIRDQCINVIAQHQDPPLRRLSQTLGPLSTWDLSLVLSLLGASRIVSSANDFPLLSQLPLTSFTGSKPADSPVYVLAGFEKSKGEFEVGVSDDEHVAWQEMSRVASLGIHEKLIPATPGAHLVSIKIPKQPPITYATHCLPNRATLVVFTEDIDGRLTLHQYILPIRVLFGFLESRVLEYLQNDPLEVVRLMFLAQIQFARKRPVFGEGGGPIQYAETLLDGKWLDPIMSLIGAYQLIRQGVLKEHPNLLDLMLQNLRTFFGGLPDTEAIAKVIGQPWTMPNAAPLLLESVLAFDENQEQRMLPLAYDQVDYGSAWTSWRDMVK
ncbi:MAG: caspase family protein [Pyrinomonadaceae bacterium]